MTIAELLQLRIDCWDEYHPNTQPYIEDKKIMQEAMEAIEELQRKE